MDNKIINEQTIKGVLHNILNEEVSKVKRDEFNRIQFKIEELENSLKDTLKELNKLQNCVPDGLKTVCNSRIENISNSLSSADNMVVVLKNKLRKYKRQIYSKQNEDKKSK